jgi:hypothetical protein
MLIDRYGPVAAALHRLIGAALLAQLAFGFCSTRSRPAKRRLVRASP